MAVGYRSSSAFPTPTDAQTSSRVVPVPAGAAAGDIAVLAVELNAGNPTITWPAGFTEKVISANPPDLSLKVAWKRLTGADTGSYTISWTGSQYNQAQCILLTGCVATGDPFEVTNTAQADFTTTVPPVAATSATAVFWLHFAALFNFRVSTPPTGYTRVQDANYLDTSYRIAGAPGAETASGGTAATATDHAVALLAVLPATASGVSGALDAPLPAFTGAYTGNAAARGSAAGPIPAMVASFTSAVRAAGAAVGSLPALVASLTGRARAAATATGDLPGFTGSFTGSTEAHGAAAGDLPALVGSLSGTVTDQDVTAVLATALPAFTGQLAGTLTGGAPTLDLDLTASVEPDRYEASLEPDRWTAIVEPDRYLSEVEP